MFFFFKQKTAYEMRISDWSSDVCSSDLGGIEAQHSRTIACHATVGTDKSIRPRLQQIGNGATTGMPGGDQNIVNILGQCEGDRIGADDMTAGGVLRHDRAVGEDRRRVV